MISSFNRRDVHCHLQSGSCFIRASVSAMFLILSFLLCDLIVCPTLFCSLRLWSQWPPPQWQIIYRKKCQSTSTTYWCMSWLFSFFVVLFSSGRPSRAFKVAGLTLLACILIVGQVMTAYFLLSQKNDIKSLEEQNNNMQAEMTKGRSGEKAHFGLD